MNRKFLGKILIVLAILIIGTTLLDYFYINFVMSSTRLSISAQQLEEIDFTPKILITGDSHAFNALDPRLISDSFNLASQGESYLQTYYKLADYLENNPHPDTVILPLDPHSFSNFRGDRIDNLYYWRDKIDWVDVSQTSNNPEFLKDWLVSTNFNFAGNIKNLFTKINNEPVELYLGHLPKPGSLPEQKMLRRGNGRARQHFKNKNPLDETLILYFNRTLDLLAANNIKIVLVKYPLTSYYLNSSSQHINLEELNFAQDQLITNCKDCVLINAQTKYRKRQLELFADSDHLNADGAELFSKFIAHQVQ